MDIEIIWRGKWLNIEGFNHANKVTHFIYGALVGGIAICLFSIFNLPAHSIAIVACSLVAVAKEHYDIKVRHLTWSKWDVLAILALPLVALITK
ncbi:hypothetical protein [Flocculibacter collagenilyticus]|uniref:hypothetical protein n=1 Tax=Flocculibacter collagenilyticus TaxID=2744479 RepID=UPI0018F60ECC|nr:hypothetical protein [Flocculibacter collagenilyticus]